jgi:hypothetical protein
VRTILEHHQQKSKDAGGEEELLYMVNKQNQTALDLILASPGGSEANEITRLL